MRDIEVIFLHYCFFKFECFNSLHGGTKGAVGRRSRPITAMMFFTSCTRVIGASRKLESRGDNIPLI
jgi:hypothetical protein